MEVLLKTSLVKDHGTGWYTVQFGDLKLIAHRGELVTPWDEDAEFRVGKNHPDTSKVVEPRIRAGSIQEQMLRLFEADLATGNPLGYTDDELEVYLARSHQSVSATRNTLMRKGLVQDGGRRRTTRSENMAIVWTRTPIKAIIGTKVRT